MKWTMENCHIAYFRLNVTVYNYLPLKTKDLHSLHNQYGY